MGSHLTEDVQYLIDVFDWDWEYSFAVSLPGLPSPHPHSEHTTLILHGRFLKPEVLSGSRIELRFSIVPGLIDSERLDKGGRKFVGAIERSSVGIGGTIFLPAHALAMLHRSAVAGRFKSITLKGDKLGRGEAFIRHYSVGSLVLGQE